jgi:hypothetical protein
MIMDYETEIVNIKLRLNKLEGNVTPVVTSVEDPIITPYSIVVTDSLDWVVVENTDAIRDLTVSPWIRQGYWERLIKITSAVMTKYPRPSYVEKFEFIDASGFDEPSPGHPEHADGKVIDGHYLVTGAAVSGHTQECPLNEPFTDIWNPDGSLNTDLFDAERMLEFVLRHREECRTGQLIMVDPIIYAIKSATQDGMIKKIVGDYVVAMDTGNHNRHFHARWCW